MNNRFKLIVPSILLMLAIGLIFVGLFNSLFAIIGGVLLLFIVLGELIVYLLVYRGRLDIITPDGSNEPFHPSVFCFDKKWNKYKYWMAYTPYPIKSEIYRDRYECPCVAASNDGYKWEDVCNNQYLDDLTEDEIGELDYFSDPELIYDKSKDELFCYYRLSIGGNGLINKRFKFFRKSTKDGKRWGPREEIKTNLDYSYDDSLVSPSIDIINGQYYLWYISKETGKLRVHRMISKNGVDWKYQCECNLVGFDIEPWHIDCKLIDNAYWLTVYDTTERITIWNSKDGVLFGFCQVAVVPTKKIYSFYRSTLYRASLCKDEKEYKLYFSAGNDRKHSIGLITGTSINNMKIKRIPMGKYRIVDFISGWTEKYITPFLVVLKKVGKSK